MPSFGEQLRREREARNVALEEVAKATRVGLHHLKALEQQDLRSLPGSVFNKGYVRAYAAFLGVDPEPLVDAYVREEQVQEKAGYIEVRDLVHDLSESIVGHAPAHRSARARLPLVLGCVGLLVVGSVASMWFLRARVGKDEALPTRPLRAAVTRRDLAPSLPAQAPDTPSVAQTPPAISPSGSTTTPAEEPPVKPAAEPPATRAAAADPQSPHEEPPIPSEDEGQLVVPEHGVGTMVVHHQLQGRGDRFAEGTRVLFWTRIEGHRGDQILHVWMREGVERSSMKLRLGASSWRTQSSKTLVPGSAGRWAVEARDARGRLLAREEFVCVPAGSRAELRRSVSDPARRRRRASPSPRGRTAHRRA